MKLDTLSRQHLEKLTSKLEAADNISQVREILDEQNVEIIGDSLQFGQEEYADAVANLYSSMGWKAIFKPKEVLGHAVADIETYSEMYVEGTRLFSYYMLDELHSLAAMMMGDEDGTLKKYVDRVLKTDGSHYTMNENDGTLTVNENGKERRVPVDKFFSKEKTRHERNAYSVLQGLEHLAEILNVLEASTDDELVEMSENTIPRVRLHASISAFEGILKEVAGIRKEYSSLLSQLGMSASQSKALALLKNAKVPLSVVALQKYREFVIKNQEATTYVEGGLIGWSALSSALNYSSTALGIGLALGELVVTHVGEAIIASVRNRKPVFQEITQEEYSSREPTKRSQFTSSYGNELIREACEYLEQHADDLINKPGFYLLNAKTTKKLYEILLKAADIPVDIRYHTMDRVANELMERYPTSPSLFAALDAVGYLDHERLNKAAARGLERLEKESRNLGYEEYADKCIEKRKLAEKKDLYRQFLTLCVPGMRELYFATWSSIHFPVLDVEEELAFRRQSQGAYL